MMDALVHAEHWKELHLSAKTDESLRSSPENPAVSFGSWLDSGEFGAASGMSITNESAMRQVAVMACVRLLAESLASLPLIVYRRTSSGGKDRADDHDVYSVLHDNWNAYQTSFVGRETQQAQVVSRGNTYALIERDGGGYLVGLWPVPPNCMEPVIDGGKLWYKITSDGTEWLGIKPGVYKAEDVLHVPGLGYDGVRGYNPIALAKDAIGLGMAAETYGSKFYANGARAGAIITTDQNLTEQQLKANRAAWNEIHSGVYSSHKTAMLSGGLKYQSLAATNEEAQFLDTRKFQLTEIARLFRVPPAMIGASTGDSQTYANHEQRMLEFVMMSLRPWCVKWEQEINRKLFTPRERARLFAEFNMDALLRSDLKARYESYSLGIDRWLTPNEVRDLENRNPIQGGDEMRPKPEPTPTVPAGAKA